MGYNTPLLILNDSLDAIEKNAEEFVKQIYPASMGRSGGWQQGEISVGRANAATVVKSQHADVLRVLVSQRNWMSDMSTYGWDFDRAKAEPHVRRLMLDRCNAAILELRRTRTALKALEDVAGRGGEG